MRSSTPTSTSRPDLVDVTCMVAFFRPVSRFRRPPEGFSGRGATVPDLQDSPASARATFSRTIAAPPARAYPAIETQFRTSRTPVAYCAASSTPCSAE